MTARTKAAATLLEGATTGPTPAERLHARRQELTGQIEQLRWQRGVALVDDVPFDGGALQAAEQALEALDDAAAELGRRAAREASERQAEARAEMEQRFDATVTEWLASIEEAEAMGRAMVAALKTAEAKGAELMPLARELTGEAPLVLMGTEQATRRSRALAGLLHGAFGSYTYGELRLPSVVAPPSEPWAEPERKLIETITHRMKGDTL